MRLKNEAVTSCKAMAMLMLCGAIVLAAAARCRDASMIDRPAALRKRPRGSLLFVPDLRYADICPHTGGLELDGLGARLPQARHSQSHVT